IEQADRRASPDADFVVASVPTLGRENSKRLEGLNPAEFSAIILDEAHHSSSKTYVNILNRFGVLNGNPHNILLTGWTATPNRADNVGLEEIFEVIAYQKTLAEMIEAKWLVPIRGYRVRTDIELSGVHTKQGDFVISELSREVNTVHRNRLVVTSYLEKANGRKAIAFAVDVQHVYDLNETFKSYGVASEALVGETPPEERQRIVAAFRRGDINVLVNCNIATEGFDVPDVSAILMARPTQSGLLYQQIIGRGTRVCDGKTDLVVIDLVDNSSRHRLVTLPSLFGLRPAFDLEGKDALGVAKDI
ncbi:MAG: DEAD/DEAH box helicase, partial [Candidatus Brocadiales bacterium]